MLHIKTFEGWRLASRGWECFLPLFHTPPIPHTPYPSSLPPPPTGTAKTVHALIWLSFSPPPHPFHLPMDVATYRSRCRWGSIQCENVGNLHKAGLHRHSHTALQTFWSAAAVHWSGIFFFQNPPKKNHESRRQSAAVFAAEAETPGKAVKVWGHVRVWVCVCVCVSVCVCEHTGRYSCVPLRYSCRRNRGGGDGGYNVKHWEQRYGFFS